MRSILLQMEDDSSLHADPHILMFETERYRPLTLTEARAGYSGAMVGMIGGIAIELNAIKRTDVPYPRVSLDYSTPAPFAMPQISLDRKTARSDTSSSPGHHNKHQAARAQPTVQPAGSPMRHQASFESQVAQVGGLTTLATVVAVVLTAGVRLIKYKSRVNFKSDLSAQELEEWYANSSVDS